MNKAKRQARAKRKAKQLRVENKGHNNSMRSRQPAFQHSYLDRDWMKQFNDSLGLGKGLL